MRLNQSIIIKDETICLSDCRQVSVDTEKLSPEICYINSPESLFRLLKVSPQCRSFKKIFSADIVILFVENVDLRFDGHVFTFQIT